MKYVNFNKEYKKEVYQLFCDFQKEEEFYKPLTEEQLDYYLFENRAFKDEAAWVALDDDKVVGFMGCAVRDSDIGNEKASGYIHTVIVKKEYRRQGIGSKLLDLAEGYIKEKGLKSSRCVFLSPINYPWLIPHTNGHMHPGTPAVAINSEYYIFLYHHGYFVNSIHEGFHVDLTKYEYPESVVQKMKKNEEKGITVELYDPNKHYGVDEFCELIEKGGNGGFAHSIRYNLYQREKPFPFVVASDNGKMIGWTGSIYKEESGRGHLDGIIVDPNYRGLGLGTAIFSCLCKELKALGSEYMTLFTGLDNPARYIYLGAGFNVACSFADMKKIFK